MSRQQRRGTPVQLFIECQKLVNLDIMSKSDPQCWVYATKRGGLRQLLGKTEVIKDNLNPKFSKSIPMQYHFEENQYLEFEVYDVDVGQNEFIGSMTCTLSEIMVADGATFSSMLKKPNSKKNRGFVYIHGEEKKEGSEGILKFRVKGKKLAKKDLFGLSDPYLTISRVNEHGQYVKVFQTETKKMTLSPSWRPVQVSLSKMCNGDLDRPLKVEVWDWDRMSEDDFIGEFQTSVNQLKVQQIYKLSNPKKKKSQGTIKFKDVSVTVYNSFLDYIRGGTEIELVVAVDFTQSNGAVNKTSSLHYLGNPNVMNSYQEAISSVGTILAHYDKDQSFPMLGFGGEVYNGYSWNVSHCFSLNGNPSNPNVHGVQGMMGAYNQAVHNVRLYGPTLFQHIISKAIEYAKQKSNNLKYTILLIITDGVINDETSTIREIVRASRLPMSIVIVGVGNANFDSMDRLDGDDVTLIDNMGNRATRDIVQFVPFNQFKHDPERLAASVLEEVPNQLVQYMSQHNIAPPKPTRFQNVIHQNVPLFQQFAVRQDQQFPPQPYQQQQQSSYQQQPYRQSNNNFNPTAPPP